MWNDILGFVYFVCFFCSVSLSCYMELFQTSPVLVMRSFMYLLCAATSATLATRFTELQALKRQLMPSVLPSVIM